MTFTDWFRIGIDVGGTFTHAVAVSGVSGEVAGAVKVSTTHQDIRGIAAGIQSSIEQLLTQTGISRDQIRLVAHSTTQTTNALLEGDLPPVGLIVLQTEAISERFLQTLLHLVLLPRFEK